MCRIDPKLRAEKSREVPVVLTTCQMRAAHIYCRGFPPGLGWPGCSFRADRISGNTARGVVRPDSGIGSPTALGKHASGQEVQQ